MVFLGHATVEDGHDREAAAELGRFLLDTACQQFAAWRRVLGAQAPVSMHWAPGCQRQRPRVLAA